MSLAANRVSLRELADLAIGTPEVGAVNFTALHTLMVAMLKSLNLEDTPIDFQHPSAEDGPSAEVRGSFSIPHMSASKEKSASKERRRSVTRLSLTPQTLESQVKDLGSQVQDLSKQVQNMDNKMQGIVQHISIGPDLYQDFMKSEEEMALLTPHMSSQMFSQIAPKMFKSDKSLETPEKSDPTVRTSSQVDQSKLSKTPKEAKVGTLTLQNLFLQAAFQPLGDP